MWANWPGHRGRPDTGVDLVALERGTGETIRIQCKFYSTDPTLSWLQHLGTFIGMLARDDFDEKLIVSTRQEHLQRLELGRDPRP